MQVIYFWIVDHANEFGQCFPGRVTLAKEAGCNVKTVDTYVKRLIEEGFISKQNRKSKGKKGLSSNMYQLLQMDKAETEPLPVLPLALTENGSPALTENGAVTIPNEQYPLTQLLEPPAPTTLLYSFKESLDKLKVSTWKVNKIIYLYFTRKNFYFDNEKQWRLAYRRCLKPGKLLEGYNSDQLWQTFEYCDTQFKDIPWSLETVVKTISNVVNKK